MRISKKRKEMGEDAWAEYQRDRKYQKSLKYYSTNKGKVNSFRVAECRRNNKVKLIEYKGGKCEKCGYNKPIPGAYDFHHKNPSEKSFAIAKAGRTISLEKLKAEADKCMLVCKLCHAEIHYDIEVEKVEKLKMELFAGKTPV